jgi:flavin reductase (DIM6/NTAB) family NADH-FMN oxidoreductase RutF
MGLPKQLVSLPLEKPIWDRFFSVFPLLLLGSLDQDGGYNLAPKHLAMPMGWENWFGFICAPPHRTYQNVVRSGAFTVSYPRPEQVVFTSLAAAPRGGADEKPALAALQVFPAQAVEGVLVEGCSLYLECRLERVVDELGPNSLLIGRVVAAYADSDALRGGDREDGEVIREMPLLAYLAPDRFAVIDRSQGFPLPVGFKR